MSRKAGSGGRDPMDDLFGSASEAADRPDRAGSPAADRSAPLAERVRPTELDEVVGQEEVLGPGGFLREAIEADSLPSMILWGPPGCGKTTLARVIARRTRFRFVPFSAVLSGVKEVRDVVAEARTLRAREGRGTLLFVDEIHRFNKAQQDAFLPHVEDGTLTLVGATTENPYFEVTAPLLSRCRVVRLLPLSLEALETLVRRTLADVDRGLGASGIQVPDEAIRSLCRAADGDGRRVLNLLEAAVGHARRMGRPVVDAEVLQAAATRVGVRHDRAYEEHYNVISAFIKSLRGSDPDAALYYFARMLEGGEDPGFICRRMMIFAAEDVGNADPRALQVAVAAHEAFRAIGLPEAAIPMAQAVTYLATAPKSNASYRGLREAQQAVRRTGTLEVPLSLRNAPVEGMKDQGYSDGYVYPHDVPGAFVPQAVYLPSALEGVRFYDPSGAGYEKTIAERLQAWREARRAARERDPRKG